MTKQKTLLDTEPPVTVSFRIPRETLTLLDAQLRALGVTRSQFLRNICFMQAETPGVLDDELQLAVKLQAARAVRVGKRK